jgi:hypothetical protein
MLVILGALVDSVLAIEPKVCGFKPDREQWILIAIQICSTASFGWEVKPSAPCNEVLRNVKEPIKI